MNDAVFHLTAAVRHLFAAMECCKDDSMRKQIDAVHSTVVGLLAKEVHPCPKSLTSP